VLVLLLLAMLGAIGLARISSWIGRPWGRRCLVAGALLFTALEFWSAPVALRYPILQPPFFAWFLRAQPDDTVVLHLPVPRVEALWNRETTYQYLSVFHWKHLINGYSGYAPPIYVRNMRVLSGFPDGESIGRLRRLHVKYVILHPVLFPRESGEYERMVMDMERTGDFALIADVRTGDMPATIFRLKSTTERGRGEP
jgi:hypothetical protein